LGNVLPHLKNSLPKDVIKHQISYYAVALEAWRRGLHVKFFNSKRGSIVPSLAHEYSIADENNEYNFICARGPHTSKEAIKITQNKPEAYTYFKRSGVPVPEGSSFHFESNSLDDIIDYGETIGFPLVVKPTDKGGGKGVFTHINSREQLKESLLKVKDDVKAKEVMVEKYVSGIDYRFFVMKDKVLGVTKSYPSYVVGDGEHTLEQLFEIMNKKIKANVVHRGKDIKVDKDLLNCLDEQGLSLIYVPKKGERVFVRKHGTHLGLRLNVDCTDEINPKFKEYAVKAINCVEGIPYGSVDMIINEDTNEGVVNEINTKGEITMHFFPMEGTARDIPKAIIDYYFPNTKRLTDTLYFDFKPIKELFLAGLAKEIAIPDLADRKLYQQRFAITGKNLKSIYLRKIRKKAAFFHLMGTIQKVKENKVELLLYGTKLQLSKYADYLSKSGTQRSIIENIESTELVEDNGNHNVSLELKDLYNKRSPLNLK
jgi:D-alanine-D-alanine ligase-like ATP-grasp enzyme/acylphosphatase